MIAGFIHLLYLPVFWVFIIAFIVLNYRLILKYIKSVGASANYHVWEYFDPWERILIVLILFYMIIRLANTFAPPITWDATTHHYLVPAMYLKRGYIYDLPHVVFSYYPSLIEMLYLLGMGLVNSDLLSSHIGWLFGPLTAGAVYVFGAKYFSRRVGLIATAILLSLGGIGVEMDGGYVDLPQGFFCLLCLYKLLDWRNSLSWTDFVLAAFLFSASLATKHLGFAFMIPVILFIIYVSAYEKRQGGGKLIKTILIFTAIALVLPLPWYLRAYILRGNPFFPFPVFGFPTLRYPPLDVTTWVNPGFKKNIISLITYLWYLTTDPHMDDALGKRFTPYFLCMLPFFWVAFRKGAFISKLLFWVSLYFMGFVFFFSPTSTRYMLIFIPFMCLLASDIINTLLLKPVLNKDIVSIYVIPTILPILLLWEAVNYFSYGPAVIIVDFVLKIALPSVFVILLGLDTLRLCKSKIHPIHGIVSIIVISLIMLPLLTRITETTAYMKDHTIKVILGIWDKDRYLLRESPRNWGAIYWMNQNLTKDAKILAVETRMYGLNCEWITWLGLEDEPIPTSPEDNVYLWKKYGFTHLWIGDDATTKTLMFYNIYHLPGEGDEVIFKLEDLWTNFFGKPFSRSIINYHLREGWLPRELKYEGYEWFENGKRMTDENGHPLYKAKRSSIANDKRKIAQVQFVESIRELVNTGGLHIVYPPPDGKIKEELTFILKTDYDTYKKSHDQVQPIGG